MITTKELLLVREVKGLKFISYFRLFFVFANISITMVVGKSLMERVVVGLISIISFLVTFYFIYLLKQKRNLSFIGIMSAILDVCLLACLPYIWHESVGGDSVPRTYMLKAQTYVSMYFAILIIHSFTIRPMYPLIITGGVTSTSILLFFYAKQDSRMIISSDFVTHMLGNTVSAEFYFSTLLTFVLSGLILAFFTYQSRKLIYEAVTLEKAKMQVSRYFSPNVFDKITTADDSMLSSSGRKQEVAVMFTDIRDFTTLSETIKPEEVVELLKEYHAKMVNIIFENGGTLDKFIGDGIMATFGTPDPKPDDAYRAVVAGTQMKKALAELNIERKKKGLIELRQGIGIHFGSVIAGNIGTENRMEYTVIGDTVNLASRIESKCKDLKSDFLISEAVKEKLNDRISTRNLGLHSVKGKTETVALYEVLS
ncbi:MAG: adenylate/guanylate cyclase domain-containing protein [Leptospiraceae bacterium]|nr:adenylate/guanylate cyclase domain-containing protein [Leptospiraceae bacterium]